MLTTTRFTTIVLILSACQFTAGQAQQLATPQELQQMFDAKQYHICLQQIARITRLKGNAASAYDMDELQLLRGECFIQIRDRVQAFRAFDTAQKSPNPKVALPARANWLILQASRGWNYEAGAGPIDIVDPQSRKQAMLVMFSTELRKADPAIRDAQNAQSLTPIIAAVPKLKDLTALELAATGQDKEIYSAFAAVGAKARELIANALQTLDGQIGTIEHRANEAAVVTSVNGGPWWVSAGRRGLDSPDRQALEESYAAAQQIYNLALQGQITAEALNGNVDRWKELVSMAGQVVTHAQNVADSE
jgi:hypothetical protein